MKASPVQLRIYVLSRLNIELAERVSLSIARIGADELFDWQGVNLGSHVEFGWADGQESDPRSFAVRLAVKVTNDSGKECPYKFDIELIGYFDLLGEIPIAEREDIARVNGASLLYGAIRDILYANTARFPKGPAVLPSMNFFDLKKAQSANKTVASTKSAA